MKKIHGFFIDCQNCFASPNGELYVQGGEKCMDNIANFVKTYSKKISKITATMDSHQIFHIAHPPFWKGRDGKSPPPFTMITLQDYLNGIWKPILPSLDKVVKNYLEQLQKNNRYVLTVWPIHAVVGTWGHNFYDSINEAFKQWCLDNVKTVDFCTKGSNPLTEHYSILVADVVDSNDPSTQVNVGLLNSLNEADIILVGGLAESHCVANTVVDCANYFGDDSLIKKMVLLEDCTTRVKNPNPGIDSIFEKMTNDFRTSMIARGMKVSTTKDFF